MSSKKMNTSPTDNSNYRNQDILSDYYIKGIIGKGTFSVVKLGVNKITKEKVAIKIMQKSKIINQEDLIRIHREIDMLSKLKHPNVIKIHKIEEDSKKFYIIMEFCENGELFNRIVEKQRLSEDEAAYFYYQIISGLEYIHKNNIAHRDLKPENLLLSKDDILKIIDFGLSNYSSFNFLLGTPCGSPCYASPEMVSGKKYNGFLIDVWSTGIILFAMICGYLPFEDNDNEILFAKILKCRIHYPKHIGELPLDLMKKIVVPEPNKRITLTQIKEHPFYLKGKFLFNQKHPEINNNKIREIIIKNVTPIPKAKSLKINDKRDNYRKNNNRYNYVINIDTINNTYLATYTENSGNDKIVNKTNYKNENRSYDIYKDENIKTKDSSLKENIDENIQNNSSNNKNDKVESTSSYLNSDEIPMDSVPKEYNGDKSDIIENSSYLKNKEKNKIKDDINSTNIHDSQRTNHVTNSTILEKSSKSSNDEKEKEKNQKDKMNEKKVIKKPRNNAKKPINIVLNKDKNIELKEKIVIEYCPEKNSNKTLECETTANSNLDYVPYTENKNIIKKSKYSVVTQKVTKTTCLNNKTQPIFDDKDRLLTEAKKIAYLSNSVPKNNEKNNKEKKYPHNNHKINNTFIKTIKNISKYNTIENNKNEKKAKNHIETINIESNVNSRSNKVNNKKNKNIINNNRANNGQKNNKQKYIDIFNELQKNKNDENVNSHTINITNIYENHSSSVDKNLNTIPIKQVNLSQIQKKESFDLNKYIQNINNAIKAKNNINIYSDRDYIVAKKALLNNKEKIKVANNRNITIGDMASSYDETKNNNTKYFDSITINNNNSINLHEPKLYIYVENNNNTIKNEPRSENIKIFNHKINKNKTLQKIDKKTFTITKANTKKNLNNASEYSKKIFKKNINNIIIDDRNNNKYENNRYALYNTTDTNKSNKTVAIFNEQNKNLIEIIKKNNLENKNNFVITSNGKIYDTITKGKDKNMAYIVNRSVNINNNNYFNHMNNVVNYPTKNNKVNIDKAEYTYPGQPFHNIQKTDVNMEYWTYDKDGIIGEDFYKNNYYINNSNVKTLRNKNKNMNVNNNFIYNPNTSIPFDNTEYKIKLQKIPKRPTVSNNLNDIKSLNYKFVAPKIHNTSDMEPITNYRKLITITTDSTHTPVLKNIYPNIRSYKKYVKLNNTKM